MDSVDQLSQLVEGKIPPPLRKEFFQSLKISDFFHYIWGLDRVRKAGKGHLQIFKVLGI